MYTINPKLPKVRMEAVRLVKYRGWSTRQVARYTGYSQSVIVKWCKKDPTGGWRPIETRSSKPNKHPNQLSKNMVNEIVKTRLEIKRSSEVIHLVLQEKGINISISSVKRTLDRKNLLNKRSPWKRYHAPTDRPEALNPGDLVQIDTIHILAGRERIYVFTILDVYSRWAYARAYYRANTRTALDFLVRSKIKAPFPFKTIQSDHGSEFSTSFTERSKLVHRHSRVRRPNDNAHLERFNRTIQEECLDSMKPDVKEINRALPKYLDYYNNRRHHFGLNLRFPIQTIPSY